MWDAWSAIPVVHEWFLARDIPLYYKSALYGFISSVALPIGALTGIILHPVNPKRTAFVVAFGAGALIFAVSTEMYAEALHQVEVDGTGAAQIEIAVSMICAVIGAVFFTYLNIKLEEWSAKPDSEQKPLIEKEGPTESPRSFRSPESHKGSSSHAALAMWLGVGLDGIPESILIGFITNEMMMTVAFLVSIFVANFPEAFSSSSMLRSKGWPTWKILCMWGSLCLSTTILSGLSSYILFALMHGSRAEAIFKILGSAVEGLAGGAMLAMVASTMLPEAYEHGGVWAGVICVLGFLASCTVKVYFGAIPGNENARHAIANSSKAAKASKKIVHLFLQKG
mmetsp:Transcript_22247/g.40898  ORF Transcript_22247/g.40898 Transcript_22247/m.40898 type:complete len:339 (+) Transcript_22247:135-1151(+)